MTDDPVLDAVGGAGPPADAAGGGIETVPGWLAALAAISWRLLAVLGLGLILLSIALVLATVTASVLVAFLVSASFAPLNQRLRDRGWSRTPAASATSVVALLTVLGVALILAVGFAPVAAALIRLAEDGFEELAAELQRMGVSPTAVTFVVSFFENLEAWLLAAVGGIVDRLGDMTTVLILGGFLTFFTLQDGDRAWGDIARSLTGPFYGKVTDRARVALLQVGSLLRAMFVLSGIDALIDLLVLLLLGVPYAGAMALLVFLGGFVPYLGAWFTITLIVLLTWLTQGAGGAAVLLAAAIGTKVVGAWVVAPRIYGPTPRVGSAVVLVALLVGASLFGFIGLVAAAPVVVAATTLIPTVIEMLNSGSPPGDDQTLVPRWLDRLGQWSWRGVVVIVVLAVLIAAILQVPVVTMSAILACVLAATLRPAVRALRARGLGQGGAALVATAGTAVIVVGVVGFTLVSLAGSARDIVTRAAEGAQETGLGSAPADLVGELGSTTGTNVDLFLANLVGVGLVVLVILLLTFTLLRDGPAWWQRVLVRVPDDRRSTLDSIGRDTADILSGYMIGTGSIALFAGVTQWLMMALLGLPLALPIGVLTFFLSFIPYIGDLIATVLGFLVALAVGSPTAIILMAVFTIVINIVQGNIVAPLVYRRTVHLHPAIALCAAPAGAALGGMMGMFLIVPFLGVIAATWRNVIRLFDPEPRQTAAQSGAPTPAPGTGAPPESRAPATGERRPAPGPAAPDVAQPAPPAMGG